MARREERAYREYVSDEQRSQPGCPARELCDESLIRDTEVRSRCLVTVNVLHSAAELSTTLRRYRTTPAPDGVGSFMEILNGVFGSGLASDGGPTAHIPAHCRVQMTLKPTSDSLIMMELWLPTQDWNGKFMGVGNGGFAGSIQGLTNEMPQALRLGYATAGTDTGHQEQGGDWAIGHPEKMIDFGYRATHEMTLKSKEIVKTFYDRSAQYSYFKGCSTGGRMALMEAQRYPDDYNGIIAGSLANRHIHMWTAGIERSINLSRHPEGAITAEQAALANNLVMNKCDTLKEGFL